METKLNAVLASPAGYATRRLPPDEQVTVGVSWEGFGELGAAEVDDELFFYHGGVSYKVSPLQGLKGDVVALIF